MKKFNVVIIDDEPDAISSLEKLLVNFTSFDLEIRNTATSLGEGIKAIKGFNPEIVFLDIDMPNEKGIEIFNHFKNPNFKIIFITAYEQYAIDALNKSASGYLLKPVNFVELQDVLQRVTDEIEAEQQQLELEDKLKVIHAVDINENNVVFDVENGFVIENLNNIEYCVAGQSYTTIVLHSKKEIVVSKPLKAIQEQLPNSHFYRTHKSFLVNVFHIRKYVRGAESYVLLKSGKKIPVSVRVSKTISNDIKQMLVNS